MKQRECFGPTAFEDQGPGFWSCACGLAGTGPVDTLPFGHRPGDLSPQELTAEYPILAFFEYAHLPEFLRPVSRSIADTAFEMAGKLAPSAEVSAGLRKLLEAKDCFVRAALYPRKAGA